ncbi:MAG TPA: hypothetical protein VKE41_24275 [Roseiflexaceae bacterium]|nr:hypothetical protein [Roseiflexaceae bacterium]
MMTTALVVLPFSFLPGIIAGPAIFACSCGLLAYGLTREAWWRLGVFGSAPFWVAFQWMQWSPLILAITLLPVLLPLFLVKPHIGLPTMLTRLTWRRALACVGFGLISLAIDPLWPLRWWSNAQGYTGFIPLLVVPGPLLLLVLARRQETRGRFLLLAGLMPQRGFYDPLVLFCLPDSPRQMLLMALGSWVGYCCSLAIGGDVRIWIVLFLYGPALLLVLLFPKREAARELSYLQQMTICRGEDILR